MAAIMANFHQRYGRSVAALIFFLGFPYLLYGQGLGREALVSFPPDTQQMAYVNLVQLRGLPNYRQLRQVLFSQEMKNFQSYMRAMGGDPEEDVNEVILGWRGSALNTSAAFGLAQGNFDPTKIQTFAVKAGLPSSRYEGYILTGYGSGGRDDLFFTYLSSDLAAFGRLNDLETLIDGYSGNRATLGANHEFANWVGEMEGSGPQWGITTGKAASIFAAPWLAGGSKSQVNLTNFLKPIKAVLYKVNWPGDFDLHVSIICQTAQDAETLERLLTLVQNALPAAPNSSAALDQFMQNLEINAGGNQIELDGSGPPALIGQILQSSRQH